MAPCLARLRSVSASRSSPLSSQSRRIPRRCSSGFNSDPVGLEHTIDAGRCQGGDRPLRPRQALAIRHGGVSLELFVPRSKSPRRPMVTAWLPCHRQWATDPVGYSNLTQGGSSEKEGADAHGGGEDGVGGSEEARGGHTGAGACYRGVAQYGAAILARGRRSSGAQACAEASREARPVQSLHRRSREGGGAGSDPGHRSSSRDQGAVTRAARRGLSSSCAGWCWRRHRHPWCGLRPNPVTRCRRTEQPWGAVRTSSRCSLRRWAGAERPRSSSAPLGYSGSSRRNRACAARMVDLSGSNAWAEFAASLPRPARHTSSTSRPRPNSRD
jgi:hypothetical protein